VVLVARKHQQLLHTTHGTHTRFQQWLGHLDVIKPRRRRKGLTWSSTFRPTGSAGSDVEGIVILDRLSQLVVMVACAWTSVGGACARACVNAVYCTGHHHHQLGQTIRRGEGATNRYLLPQRLLRELLVTRSRLACRPCPSKINK
jgi:hypothetical protein